jgi:hypothetical protein
MNTRMMRLGIAAALAGGAVATTGGLAYAGSLPGAAQDVAGTMLAAAGVTVPGPNQHAGTHPDARGQSSPAEPTASADSGKGSDISALARTTDATGRAKGAVISAAASDGRRHAGDTAASSAATPNSGGTGTADEASSGDSGHGTGVANDASGGVSLAGSGNRP